MSRKRLAGVGIHTKTSAIAGLVAGLIAVEGHAKEKAGLIRYLSEYGGDYFQNLADTWNLQEKAAGEVIYHDDDTEENETAAENLAAMPDFPDLTGDSKKDAKALSAWFVKQGAGEQTSDDDFESMMAMLSADGDGFDDVGDIDA